VNANGKLFSQEFLEYLYSAEELFVHNSQNDAGFYTVRPAQAML